MPRLARIQIQTTVSRLVQYSISSISYARISTTCNHVAHKTGNRSEERNDFDSRCVWPWHKPLWLVCHAKQLFALMPLSLRSAVLKQILAEAGLPSFTAR
jgi:type III secretory pathway lipoprotein EscJ